MVKDGSWDGEGGRQYSWIYCFFEIFFSLEFQWIQQNPYIYMGRQNGFLGVDYKQLFIVFLARRISHG
jgi:hypothetical protein